MIHLLLYDFISYFTDRVNRDCPLFWNLYGSSCFMTTFVSMSFYEARKLCGYHKSDLVWLSLQELQTYVENLIKNESKSAYPIIELTGQSFWLGLFKADNKFLWLQDDTELHPADKLGHNWNSSNNRCAVMKYGEAWEWHTVDCNSYKANLVCRRIVSISGMVQINVFAFHLISSNYCATLVFGI